MYVSFSETPCVVTFTRNVECHDKISVIDIVQSLGIAAPINNWIFFLFLNVTL